MLIVHADRWLALTMTLFEIYVQLAVSSWDGECVVRVRLIDDEKGVSEGVSKRKVKVTGFRVGQYGEARGLPKNLGDLHAPIEGDVLQNKPS